MVPIGNRIKQIRKELGLSQECFGHIISISNGHLSAIERDKVVPSERILRLICSEFNINDEWLRNGTGEKNSVTSAVNYALNDEIKGLKRFDNFSRLMYDNNKKYLRLFAILAPGSLADGTLPLENEPDLICMVNYLQYRFLKAKDEKEKMFIAVRFESVFPDYIEVVSKLSSSYEKLRKEIIATAEQMPSYNELYRQTDDILRAGKMSEDAIELIKSLK